MTSRAKHIIIAESQSISQYGLKTLCLDLFPNALISEVASANALIQSIRKVNHVDFLLTNLFLAHVSIMPALAEIKNLHPGISILVVSDASELVYGSRVLKEGAKGFINNMEDRSVISKAIRTVAEGRYFIGDDIYTQVFEKQHDHSNPFKQLSNKEMDIVHYLLLGMSTTEISDKARLAVSTVSTYKMRIFNKLQIDNLVSLVELAASFDLVQGKTPDYGKDIPPHHS